MRLVITGLLVAAVALIIATGPEHTGEAAWPGANGRIVYAEHRLGGIWTMDPDGSDRQQLTTEEDFYPSWSPDGTLIVFQRGVGFGDPTPAEIWTMNATGGNMQMVTHGETPSWSPDGTSILYSENGHIKVIPAGGGLSMTLTKEDVTDAHPVYRPTGDTIAFLRFLEPISGLGGEVSPSGFIVSDWDVYIMDADGSNATRISADNDYSEGPPDWSPDGSKLIFTGPAPGQQGVAGAPPPGAVLTWNYGSSDEPSVLIHDPSNGARYPSYSPDGSKIVVSRDPATASGGEVSPHGITYYELWTANANGSNLQQIPHPSGGDDIELHGDWQPTTATPTPSPSPEPTISPSPTVTPSPTATIAPTPSTAPIFIDRDLVWGDAQCDGVANPVDSLITLRVDAGLSANYGGCPALGKPVQVLSVGPAGLEDPQPWGDVDCDDLISPTDALKILRYDAALDYSQAEGCPPIGADVSVRYKL